MHVPRAAERGRPADIRRLRPRLLAEHGASGELRADQDAAKRLVALSHPVDESNGTWAYRLVLDPEGHATLDGLGQRPSTFTSHADFRQLLALDVPG